MPCLGVLVTQDADPPDDGVERRAHFVAERSQKYVLRPVGRFGFPPRCLFVSPPRPPVAVDLSRITANGLGERLVDRLVEPCQVIYVAPVWRRLAFAPKSEPACRKGPALQRAA